jgi:hypothetical protein
MDVEEFTISSVLASHEGAIRAICVLDDGSIVTGAQDSLAKRWVSVPVMHLIIVYYTYCGLTRG